MAAGPVDETIYRLAELRLLGHRAIQGVTASVVVLILLRTPAKLFPKKQVQDPSFSKGVL
jgi:hypothetical protein